LCGDHYTVYVQVENDKVVDIAFEGSGCAISKASASIMSQELKGKSITEVDYLFRLFQKVVTGETDAMEHLEELGKLAAFAGVAEFPVRVKCAILSWHALNGALHEDRSTISTEE